MTETIPWPLWRIELLHPAIVHFPIALLLVTTILEMVAWLWPRYRVSLRNTTGLLLVLGTFAAWGACLSGEAAESIVNRVICDPTITKDHGFFADLSKYVFSAATVILFFEILGKKWNVFGMAQSPATLLRAVLTLCLIGGSALLLYTSSLGASLVYQQAAAVYKPTEACTEFE